MYQKHRGQGGTQTQGEFNQLSHDTLALNARNVVIELPEHAANDNTQAQVKAPQELSLSALQGNSPQAQPQAQLQTLQSLQALAQQPGTAWLGEVLRQQEAAMQADPQRSLYAAQVLQAAQQWDYKQQGLTEAGAAVVAIVVAYFTAGAASGLGTSAASTAGMTTTAGAAGASSVAVGSGVVLTTGGAAVSAAVATGVSTLASQAAVSFINNGGDIGQTLKDLGQKDGVKNLLTAMLTGGALSSLGNTTFFGDKPLNQITAADGFGAHLGKSVVNNVANATMTSALTGASLQDSIKSALTSAFISAGAGQTANSIGDLTPDSPYLNALAHALAGCVAGAAGQGGSAGCTAGASGAVVGELAAQWYDPHGLNKPEDTLNFVKLISAAAGALTGDGSAASVNTAANAGVNAALNNRLLHFDEKERIRLAAEGDADKQARLTKAACFEVKCWAQYPVGSELYKANYVSVAEMSGLQVEWDWVRGQKNVGSFAYTPSQQFTDWVASNTGMASGTLNGRLLDSSDVAITSRCANGDTSCITGVGQQQNDSAPLTEAEKKARAEYFGNWSIEYQRSANLAVMMKLPQVALSYEIASGVTALLEQAYQPILGKVVVDTLFIDEAVNRISKETGIPRLYVQEVAERAVKPKLESVRLWVDGGAK